MIKINKKSHGAYCISRIIKMLKFIRDSWLNDLSRPMMLLTNSSIRAVILSPALRWEV